MKVVVLGATGFIGGQIAKEALKKGWYVRGLRRNPDATGILDSFPIQWVFGELSNQESLHNALRGMDVVFHAAGFYPKRNDHRPLHEQIQQAKTEIDNLIEATYKAKVKKLIYTSSLSTIGFPPSGSGRLANEDDFYRSGNIKHNSYYEAKLIMEQRLLDSATSGLPVVILNPTAVFGPGDVHLTMGKILIAAAKGKMIAWIPGIINVVDVRDVAEAHIHSIELGAIGERYILAGYNLSVKEALCQVADVAEKPRPRFQIPAIVLRLLIKVDNLLPGHNLTGNHLQAILLWQGFDNTKARNSLQLKLRPFTDTIRDSLIWFKRHGYI